MRIAWVAGLTSVLLSCSQPGASNVTPAATPSPAPGSPVGQLELSCRLPVVVGNTVSEGFEYDGGFIKFPGASYKADPSGVIRRPPGLDDFVTTAARPPLSGVQQNGPPSFDAAVGRWVPASSAQTSSDGLRYAYTTGIGNGLLIHVVDVSKAVDKTFGVDLPAWNYVADYDSGIVYLTGTALGGPGYGVWAFDTATGSTRQLSKASGVLAIRGGYSWMGRFDARDTTPQGYSELAAINTVVRVNLATGAETLWYYHPGQYLSVSGFDAGGAPVISLPARGPYDEAELRLVREPGTSGLVVSRGGVPLSPAQSDGDRLWFGGRNGIYLFTETRGLVKVFTFNGNGNLQIYPAGRCV
jgi:hypothetical protein